MNAMALSPLLRAGLVLALAACSKAESSPRPAGAQGYAPPPMPVEVAVARTDTVVDAILATGEIEAMQSIELRPEIEGRIAAILVREGALVARGTPLFKVDDAELKAQVARAVADRDLARQSLARTRDLLAQKVSSQAELERAEATSRSDEGELLFDTRSDGLVTGWLRVPNGASPNAGTVYCLADGRPTKIAEGAYSVTFDSVGRLGRCPGTSVDGQISLCQMY